ncbi:hypothetical protein ACEPAF_3425 [Sanghuangporus sanghuang]
MRLAHARNSAVAANEERTSVATSAIGLSSQQPVAPARRIYTGGNMHYCPRHHFKLLSIPDVAASSASNDDVVEQHKLVFYANLIWKFYSAISFDHR